MHWLWLGWLPKLIFLFLQEGKYYVDVKYIEIDVSDMHRWITYLWCMVLHTIHRCGIHILIIHMVAPLVIVLHSTCGGLAAFISKYIWTHISKKYSLASESLVSPSEEVDSGHVKNSSSV